MKKTKHTRYIYRFYLRFTFGLTSVEQNYLITHKNYKLWQNLHQPLLEQ